MISGKDIFDNLLDITISIQRFSYGTHLNCLPCTNESKPFCFVCVGEGKISSLSPVPGSLVGAL